MTEDDPACPPDPDGPSQLNLGSLVTTPCVEWEGCRDKQGYGQVKRKGRKWSAHRWAWTEANGPIPDGLCVLHRCDNPPCTRIDHLFLGTKADNSRDMFAKGRAVGNTRFTDEVVEEIRNAAGTQREIGALYGMSAGYVCDLRNGKYRTT